MTPVLTRFLATVFCALVGLCATAAAQTQVRGVMGSGGTAATSGSMFLVGTIGQHLIGPAGNTTTNAWMGFWYTISTEPPASVREEYVTTGGATAALACSPNPFSSHTEIRVRLDRSGPVRLVLFNALGRQVRTLLDGEREAGTLAVTLDGFELESGNYIARLETGYTREAIRLVVAK